MQQKKEAGPWTCSLWTQRTMKLPLSLSKSYLDLTLYDWLSGVSISQLWNQHDGFTQLLTNHRRLPSENARSDWDYFRCFPCFGCRVLLQLFPQISKIKVKQNHRVEPLIPSQGPRDKYKEAVFVVLSQQQRAPFPWYEVLHQYLVNITEHFSNAVSHILMSV